MYRNLISDFTTVSVNVLLHSALPLGIISTLSSLDGKLVPCNDGCPSYKMFNDGVFPRTIKLNSFDLNSDVNFLINGDNVTLDARFNTSMSAHLPRLLCTMENASTMKARCASPAAMSAAINTLQGSLSEHGFLCCVGLWTIFNFIHDFGLTRGWLSQAGAMGANLSGYCALLAATCFAVMWACGAAELFYAPLEDDGGSTCGCVFQMRTTPAVLAMAVPYSMLMHVTAKITNILRAMLTDTSYLITQKYHVSLNLLRAAGLSRAQTLVGPQYLGAFPEGDQQLTVNDVKMQRSLAAGYALGIKLAGMFSFSSLALFFAFASLPFGGTVAFMCGIGIPKRSGYYTAAGWMSELLGIASECLVRYLFHNKVFPLELLLRNKINGDQRTAPVEFKDLQWAVDKAVGKPTDISWKLPFEPARILLKQIVSDIRYGSVSTGAEEPLLA